MGAEIDRLDINIETQSTKAVAALDTLIKKLESVSASVGKINGSNLASFANGIEKICNFQYAKNSSEYSCFSIWNE